jgi:transcription antitermination factor NusG
MSDTETTIAPYWCTVQTQAHCERKAQRFLELFGFEVYLPRVWQGWRRFGRHIQVRAPYFPSYCFVRVILQWRSIHGCPGVTRVVRIGADAPVRVADTVIDALRKRERDGAIDLPANDRRRKVPRIGDRLRVVSGPFVSQSGLCTQVSRQQVGVLLLMFKAQRQVQLRRDAVELV